MPLVKAQCENCNSILSVDSSKKAAICEFCGTPYVVQDAINHYTTHVEHLHADVVNIQSDLSSDARVKAAEAYMKIHQYGNALAAYKDACALTPQNYICWWGQVCAISENFTKEFKAKHELDRLRSLYENALVFVPEQDRACIEQQFNDYYQPLWDQYSGKCNSLKSNIQYVKSVISQQNNECARLQKEIKSLEDHEYRQWGCSGSLLFTLGFIALLVLAVAWNNGVMEVSILAGAFLAVIIIVSIISMIYSFHIKSKIKKKEATLQRLRRDLTTLQSKNSGTQKQLVALESELLNFTIE